MFPILSFLPRLRERLVRERRDWLFAATIGVLCLLLLSIDLAPKDRIAQGLHARALVTAVDNSRVRVNLIVKTEDQYLEARLLDGPHAGAEVGVANMLLGKLEFDEFYTVGQTILVEYDVTDGQPDHVMARGVYRLDTELLMIGLFVLLLLAVAGVTGLKAALSFIFTALLLWKLLFPLILMGYPAIVTALVIVAILTAVITLSVGGLNRRGLATFCGAMLGVLLTCILATWLTGKMHLHGAVRPFAETLLYSGYLELDLTAIFIASVFLASSGAVMDLAMDIAASMHEIKIQQPAIGFRRHLTSGLSVARAVIGTMTTTLLLAYSSAHVTMFLLFMAKGLPGENILNAPFIAAEILNILVGSFGLMTVAPFTAVVAALLYSPPRRADGRADGRLMP